MQTPNAWILKTGMITAIGDCAPQTTASFRAGITRLVESDIINAAMKPMTLALVPDEAIPPLHEELVAGPGLTTRHSRMIRLAARALCETVEALPFSTPLPLFMALPETLPGSPPVELAGFMDQLATQSGIAIDVDHSQVFPSGRAGGFQALDAAIQCLNQGKAHHTLCGGVDSYLDLHLLNTLDQEDRVLAEGVMEGFAPGEGASFLLLSTQAGRNTFAEGAMVKVYAPGIASEPGHRYSDTPLQGEGLTLAVQAALGENSCEPILTIMAGFNGENMDAKEWGIAYLRNQASIDSNFVIEHPADCFGDAGAAMAPLLIGLAAADLQKELKIGPTLVFCSSDKELRGAVRMENISEKED